MGWFNNTPPKGKYAGLCALFARDGLTMPENTWPGKVVRYASLQEACEAGEANEISNSEPSERLLEPPDIHHDISRSARGVVITALASVSTFVRHVLARSLDGVVARTIIWVPGSSIRSLSQEHKPSLDQYLRR